MGCYSPGFINSYFSDMLYYRSFDHRDYGYSASEILDAFKQTGLMPIPQDATHLHFLTTDGMQLHNPLGAGLFDFKREGEPPKIATATIAKVDLTQEQKHALIDMMDIHGVPITNPQDAVDYFKRTEGYYTERDSRIEADRLAQQAQHQVKLQQISQQSRIHIRKEKSSTEVAMEMIEKPRSELITHSPDQTFAAASGGFYESQVDPVERVMISGNVLNTDKPNKK